MEKRIITFTTDFGTKDPFIGQMKGIIKRINPETEITDITHEITPHNIKEAAVVTALSYKYFPSRTIHLVVVDPTVGSTRRPLLVVTENYYFIGPDNGIFSLVYKKEKMLLRVIHITADHYFLKKESPTFQGRDLFAPVAAWLSKGIPVDNFGEEIEDYVRLPFPEPSRPAKGAIEGEIIYIDRFGNAMTNITSDILIPHIKEGKKLTVIFKGKKVPMKSIYTEAEDKDLYCLINSFEHLELFVYRGDASKEFNISVGDIVGIIIN